MSVSDTVMAEAKEALDSILNEVDVFLANEAKNLENETEDFDKKAEDLDNKVEDLDNKAEEDLGNKAKGVDASVPAEEAENFENETEDLDKKEKGLDNKAEDLDNKAEEDLDNKAKGLDASVPAEKGSDGQLIGIQEDDNLNRNSDGYELLENVNEDQSLLSSEESSDSDLSFDEFMHVLLAIPDVDDDVIEGDAAVDVAPDAVVGRMVIRVHRPNNEEVAGDAEDVGDRDLDDVLEVLMLFFVEPLEEEQQQEGGGDNPLGGGVQE